MCCCNVVQVLPHMPQRRMQLQMQRGIAWHVMRRIRREGEGVGGGGEEEDGGGGGEGAG